MGDDHARRWGSQATAAGLSGASLAPDGEIADAELAAIHAYLRRVVERSADPTCERVLIMSDSLGCLDSLEAAWRARDARGLRTRDRGAMLESCCVLRAQLQLVVFMYVSAHSGNAMNAMADAAAKAHVHAPADDLHDVPTRVTSRPIVYKIASDFDVGGRLQPPDLDENGRLRAPRTCRNRPMVIWDRRLFSGVRVRVARWVHWRLVRDLHGTYVDEALIGRRWHASDARTYAAVAKAVYTCATLKGGKEREADPVARMADDTLPPSHTPPRAHCHHRTRPGHGRCERCTGCAGTIRSTCRAGSQAARYGVPADGTRLRGLLTAPV